MIISDLLLHLGVICVIEVEVISVGWLVGCLKSKCPVKLF